MRIVVNKFTELNEALLVWQSLQFKLNSQLGAGEAIRGLLDIA
jgi:hypothetical protein